jgi:hypothetical protein
MLFIIIDSLGDFRQALENGSCDCEFGSEPLSPHQSRGKRQYLDPPMMGQIHVTHDSSYYYVYKFLEEPMRENHEHPLAEEHIMGEYVFLLLSSWAVVTMLQVISLGDIIKFSISPSTTKDSLTTNASGVPLDEKNLVCSLHIIHTSQQHCRHTSALPFSNMLAVLPSSYSLTLFASQYVLYLPF